MLGEKITELRKKKGISQEELADVLSTSRQAISKWERGESDPDISRLKDLAVYFNVSIDYLMGYDVESTSVNNFINRLKDHLENGVYDISLDEIKMIVSRNNNYFNLFLASINYLAAYYYAKRDSAILDALEQYLKKAILLYQPNNNVNLNDLHLLMASLYALRGDYELSKEYLKENQVVKAEYLTTRCELELGHYEEVEKVASEVFLSSIGSLINNSAIQIRVLLRTNRVKEALELTDWSINLIKSVGKKEENFRDMIFIFTFLKAYAEKTLGLNYSSSLKFLKDNADKISRFKSIKDGFKFYNNQNVIFASESENIKSDLLKEFNKLKENNAHGYQNAFDIFNEVFGE